MRSLLLLPVAGLLLAGCLRNGPSAPETPLLTADSAQLLEDLGVLAADSMQGRATGTPGSEKARRYLRSRFAEIGLQSFGSGYDRPFEFPRGGETARGINLVGYVEGSDAAAGVIVVTAHYDHVGVQNGAIYNGADDNASGTAALLAIAQHLVEERPRHTVILAALDAEEVGLRGARALVSDPPVAKDRIRLNINMDMVGRNARGELYAAGTYHYPQLRPLLEQVADGAPVRLRLGHDSPTLPPGDDWTQLSDHGAFHAAGIPFVYFGVEDHPDYHEPTDDVERIEPRFFANAVATIIEAVEVLDAN